MGVTLRSLATMVFWVVLVVSCATSTTHPLVGYSLFGVGFLGLALFMWRHLLVRTTDGVAAMRLVLRLRVRLRGPGIRHGELPNAQEALSSQDGVRHRTDDARKRLVPSRKDSSGRAASAPPLS